MLATFGRLLAAYFQNKIFFFFSEILFVFNVFYCQPETTGPCKAVLQIDFLFSFFFKV